MDIQTLSCIHSFMTDRQTQTDAGHTGYLLDMGSSLYVTYGQELYFNPKLKPYSPKPLNCGMVCLFVSIH